MTEPEDTHPRTSRRLTAGRRVRDLLRSAIVHDEIDETGTLPSEGNLISSFSTSRQVVRDALSMLSDEGLVRRSRGSGTLSTASMIRHDFRFLHGPQTHVGNIERRILLCAEQAAPPLVSERLELPSGTGCGVVETVTLLDGEPLDVATIYVPPEFLTSVQRLESSAEWFSLYDRAGVQLGATDHTIEAVVADELVAGLLHVATGHPLMLLERLVRDHRGRPLEYGFTRVRGDRLVLTQSSPMTRPANITPPDSSIQSAVPPEDPY
jgi:GntR family transcriptional regulator